MAVTHIKPKFDKRGRIVGYTDKYTEEDYGFPVIFGRKKNPYNKGWIMNSQEALEIVAKDKDIKGETYRVLFFICARLDFENWVQIPLSEVAQELDLKKQSVTRAIKILESKEIIIRGPKVGRSYAFMLNPDFGWKGKVKNLDEYRKERNEQILREHREQEMHSSLELIESKKKENATSKIISLLQSEDIDLDKLNEFIEQKRKAKVGIKPR